MIKDINCPANYPFKCQDCPYSKEGLCDYPYTKANLERITGGEE